MRRDRREASSTTNSESFLRIGWRVSSQRHIELGLSDGWLLGLSEGNELGREGELDGGSVVADVVVVVVVVVVATGLADGIELGLLDGWLFGLGESSVVGALVELVVGEELGEEVSQTQEGAELGATVGEGER